MDDMLETIKVLKDNAKTASLRLYSELQETLKVKDKLAKELDATKSKIDKLRRKDKEIGDNEELRQANEAVLTEVYKARDEKVREMHLLEENYSKSEREYRINLAAVK
jgi:hypothetical protein